MNKINLPESDLAAMKQFYQEELNKTLQRLNHIKSILEKLGDSMQSINIQINTTESGSAVAAATETAPEVQKRKRRKRPGRKSMWEELIVKELKNMNKPMTYDQLTEAIMKYGNIPESKRENTKRAITNLVFRLRKQNRKLTTVGSGTREKLIALNAWMENESELKDPFKVELPSKRKEAPKPTGRKRGRPRKTEVAPAKTTRKKKA